MLVLQYACVEVFVTEFSDKMSLPHSPEGFPATSLNLLESLQSADSSKREVSVARFCTMYYPPIYGLIRGLGYSAGQAESRAQEFFVHMMQDRLLERYVPAGGSRFSLWLIERFRDFEAGAVVSGHEQGLSEVMPQMTLDSSGMEERYNMVNNARLEPGPAFDLTLAQEIWRTAKLYLQRKHQRGQYAALVKDLLPFVLHETWPQPPAPSLEDMAKLHKQTPAAVKNFMNRTLRRRARSAFDDVALTDSPGWTEQDLDHLWLLLCRYGESM